MDRSLTRISVISLFVEDVVATRDFYRSVFGVEVVFEDDDSAAVRFDGLLVNLLAVRAAAMNVEPAPVADRAAGVRSQLSIWVEDVDAVCERLRGLGVELLVGPVDRPWGMRVATFVDPGGHSWEVAQEVAAS